MGAGEKRPVAVLATERPPEMLHQRMRMELGTLRTAIDRWGPRINAVHAHRQLLDRAAHDLDAVERRLEALVDERQLLGDTQETTTDRLAVAAMREHLDMVLQSPLPVEQERQHLIHTLFRAGIVLDQLAAATHGP